ncbi:hypothetical protein ASPFODRAFT_56140 [Aspergillus luchuensis CBS 106.47]|uniref:Uncharacterized protein n=1 Tax=Aspergillus luchuensis (strain CBS 106.47) TaxID=1137211 RepID=A0A1M3U0L9_ASPLC|nr:hypothetical protein ASPFODRAFT_56140 [Aspergillus luchuensis CBS 106.47]
MQQKYDRSHGILRFPLFGIAHQCGRVAFCLVIGSVGMDGVTLEKLKLTIQDYGFTSIVRLPSIPKPCPRNYCSIGYNVAAIGRSRLITLCAIVMAWEGGNNKLRQLFKTIGSRSSCSRLCRSPPPSIGVSEKIFQASIFPA